MYEDIFSKIRNEAEMRNLRESTINAYCNSVDYFLRIVNKDFYALTTDDVEAFLTEKRLNGLSPQTYNHYHSSIRFFYKRILKMNWDDEDIPRMKLDHSLPRRLPYAAIFWAASNTYQDLKGLMHRPLSSYFITKMFVNVLSVVER